MYGSNSRTANERVLENEFGVSDAIDETPKVVGVLVIGSVLVLAALKGAGFRFNFGVSGKVG